MVRSTRSTSIRRRFEGSRPQSDKLARFLNERNAERGRSRQRSPSPIARGASLPRQEFQFAQGPSEHLHAPRNGLNFNETEDDAREPSPSENKKILQLAYLNKVEYRKPRTIPCAQDFYPTTFDKSSRDFSPVRLRKKLLPVKKEVESDRSQYFFPFDGSLSSNDPERFRSKSVCDRSYRQGLNSYLKKQEEKAAYADLSRRQLSPERMNPVSMRELMKKINKQHFISVPRALP